MFNLIFKENKNYKKNYKIKLLCYLFLAIILVFLDQLIKNNIINKIKLEESVIIIPSFLKFTHVKNYGAAYSILFKKTKLLIVFTFLILICLVVYLIKKKNKNKNYLFSITLIISGGLGNLIDRIIRGYVTDYINFIYGPFKYIAIFNFADLLIVFGSILFLINFIINEFYLNNFKKRKKA